MWNGCLCRRAGLSISKTADLLGFSRITISSVYREWSEKEKICLVDVRGQRRMGRMVRDDRNATVTKITPRYNQGMQNTISERTTRRTLKQMGYSSRRQHLLSLGLFRPHILISQTIFNRQYSLSSKHCTLWFFF